MSVSEDYSGEETNKIRPSLGCICTAFTFWESTGQMLCGKKRKNKTKNLVLSPQLYILIHHIVTAREIVQHQGHK